MVDSHVSSLGTPDVCTVHRHLNREPFIMCPVLTVCLLMANFLIVMPCFHLLQHYSVLTTHSLRISGAVLSPPLLDLLDVLDANGAAAAGAEWARLFPGRAFPRNYQ